MSIVCGHAAECGDAVLLHILRNDSLFKDEVGQLFLGVEGAKAHASVIARELAEDTGWEGFSILRDRYPCARRQ